MSIHIRTVSFTSGTERKPSIRRIRLGFETDNLIERLEFVLPQISERQTAALMIGGGQADAITLKQGTNGRYYVDLTREIIGADGERTVFLRIDGSGGEVWNSGAMQLITGALPDVSEEIEQRFPTAVETMLTEIAGHREDMADALTKAEDAVQRAEDAKADAVLYTGQSLTDEQKAQARENIGAMPADTPIPPPYVLPAATADTLGGVKIGGGLKMDGDGRVSADLGGYYTREETDAAIGEATKEGEWEKIEAFTIEEELTKVSRTAFSDGTPYNLAAAKVMVKFYYPVVKMIGLRVDFKSGNEFAGCQVITVPTITNTTPEGSTFAYCYSALTVIKPVLNCYEITGARGAQGGEMIMICPPNNTYQSVSVNKKITEIDCVAWQNTLPAGTTIEIWGVRANA